MTTKKTNRKIKLSFFSLMLAIAMLLSFNFPFAYSLANNISYAADTSSESSSYSYKAEVDKYEFTTNQFSTSNSDTSSAINNGKVDISGHQDLISYVTNNKDTRVYYPIVKFNGISTQKDIRDTIDNLADVDTADNFGGMIVANNYRVAKKNYQSTYKTITKDATELKVVYLMITQGSDTEEQHIEKINALKTKVEKLNEVLGYTGENLRYAVINQHESTYDGSDYTYIGTDTEDYSDIKTEATSDPVTQEASLSEFDITKYSLYFRRNFEWEENKLYLYTSTKSSGTSTLSLTNNSYYAVSVWVYTAGDATATIELTGTNFDATITGISTEGKWVQYYLFIASRPQDSTSINIRLYYGDTYGVTGKNNMSDYGSADNDYLTTLLKGAVFFDNLNFYTIDYTDFVNRTINGFVPNTIAKKYLASTITDITAIENNKEATLATEIVDGKEVTHFDHYTPYAKYTNYDELSAVDTYVARYSRGDWEMTGGFDLSFDTYNGLETNGLVYGYNETEINTLNFNSYQSNLTYPFSLYMPRYSSGTTWLTDAEKNIYRTTYKNGALSVKGVKESETFDEYERVVLDELGNVVQEEQIIDGETKKVDKKETVHNSTFSADSTIIELKNTSSYELGVVSPALLVPASAVYRISVWAYSSDKEATATAKLFSTIQTKTSSVYGELVLATKSVTDFEYNSNNTNGWKEIVLYVKANPTATQRVNLALISSKNTTVYFDNIKVEAVTSSSFVSSDGINLSTYGVLSSNVTNGNFNSFSVSAEDDTATYPYTADSWTVVSNGTSDGVVRGVISTTNDYEAVVPARDKKGNIDYYDQEKIFVDGGIEKYDDNGTIITLEYGVNYLKDYAGKYIKATTIKEMFGNQEVPKTVININGSDVELTRENVFAVSLPDTADEEQSKFLMRSSSITFSSNKLYKLTFQVWFGTDFEGNFVSKLTNGTSDDAKTITALSLKTNDSTHPVAQGKWQTFTIYVRTGNTSASMPLLIGAENSKGTMFIQKVDYIEISEKTYGNVTKSIDEQYNDEYKYACDYGFDVVTPSGEVQVKRFVDLKNNNFANHSQKADENQIYEAYGYSLETKPESASYTQGQIGVVDLNTGFTYGETTNTGAVLNDNTDAKTALLLVNTHDTDYTVAKSVFNNTIDSKKYVKVTVDILTSEFAEDNGLSIVAEGFEAQFTDVSSNGEWKTYTFYLRTGDTSIGTFALTYSLGKSENSYKGWAMLSNMQLVELTEDEYKTATTAEGISEDKTVVIKSLAKEESSSTDEDKKSESESNFSWQLFFYVLSSILLVGSLVVALVAVIIKRKHKGTPQDKETPSQKSKTEGGIQ